MQTSCIFLPSYLYLQLWRFLCSRNMPIHFKQSHSITLLPEIIKSNEVVDLKKLLPKLRSWGSNSLSD